MSQEGLLSRRRTVALKLESTEGTWASPGSADADFNISAASWRPIVNAQASDNLSDTFTKSPPRNAGVAQGEITFTTELAGITANNGFVDYDEVFSNALPIFKCLEACGMTMDFAHYALIGSVGTSIHADGEALQDGSGNELAAAGNTWNGVPRLWTKDDGPAAYNSWQGADVITGQTNSATATITAGTAPPGGSNGSDDRNHNDRPHVRPLSDPLFANGNHSASIKVWHDGKEFSIRGARGTFTMEATFGGTIKFNFRFVGILVTGDTGDAASTISQTLALQLAPVWTGVALSAQTQGSTTATQQLSHASLSLDYGNEIILREDASDASGYSCAVIVNRAPVLRISPDETLVSAGIDWTTELTDGTPFDLFASVNATSTTPGGRFDFKFHGAVPKELTPGDRDGVETADLVFDLTGGSLPDGSEMSDGEFMLFNW